MGRLPAVAYSPPPPPRPTACCCCLPLAGVPPEPQGRCCCWYDSPALLWPPLVVDSGSMIFVCMFVCLLLLLLLLIFCWLASSVTYFLCLRLLFAFVVVAKRSFGLVRVLVIEKAIRVRYKCADKLLPDQPRKFQRNKFRWETMNLCMMDDNNSTASTKKIEKTLLRSTVLATSSDTVTTRK